MKQVQQNLKSGDTNLLDVPCPLVGLGKVLIRTARSLISAGTERMLVEFGQANLLQKARSQPDKVRQVLDKIRADGLAPTLEAVFKRLDEPLPLGYCNAGVVEDVGAGVTGFKPGDRVASNGPHAEYVCVPQNLCARIPDKVSDEEAAFTVLSSIGLQGVRLLQPTLGEQFVVYGAGLIGLTTIQLLRASGCAVLAVDVNAERLRIAAGYGAQTCHAEGADPVTAALAWTNGAGADGVLITASARDDSIVHQAATMCRKRGRIVLVGVVNLNLSRADFYEKELSFQVSCSYGPGRYDEKYEQRGQDYPRGFVRWTEQRNFEAVLAAMADGQLNVRELITHRVRFDEAVSAYDRMMSDPHSLGVILEYPAGGDRSRTIPVSASPASATTAAAGECVAAMIGAGNFAKMTMAPALKTSGARLKYVADTGAPVAATHLARKYGFEQATSDTAAVLADPDVNTIFIATGHSSHADLIVQGLEAGKHVFVEKPLALNREDVSRVQEAAARHPDRRLMLGFNRRFSPHTVRIRELLAGRSEPLTMSFTCNAGIIPPGVWVHDPERGGGRIVGEACHFMDLLSHIAGSPIECVAAMMVGSGVAVLEDKMSILLRFADGSIGAVHYFANGHKGYPKERLEVFSEGRVLVMDNFRELRGWGFRGFSRMKTRSNKGHREEFAAFVKSIKSGGAPLIPLDQAVNVTLASFAAMTAARENRTVNLAED
ncbi:MAG: bi-domain-containing oxidoreductase [Kiritimatiellae bacterium]|nr:bi-domain-containing oxidoreductase [Kiritimatiellia bacterium]